ncbi:FAD-dependent oxidoreductase [Rhodovibrio sodomensis]|uniref:FAD-dependent oxidoreductase n=1 Tax=Rhodovibrio sodomensis TaxID=1088 RepID=UPI001A92D6AE
MPTRHRLCAMTEQPADLAALTAEPADLVADVAVIGGGITGLAMTLALGRAGFRTICIDPQPPEPAAAQQLDGRTTALLMPSIRALQTLGVWERVAGDSEGLWRMRIVDDSAGPDAEPHTADFESSRLDGGPFGYNVPNPALRRALLAEIGALDQVRHLAPHKVGRIDYGRSEMRAELDDGRRLSARLAIGADGKGSPSREAAGIRARRWGYGQTAMAFSIQHSRPHRGTSTEFHRSSGPFVLVPLPGNRSSVVWVDRDAAAERFLEIDDDAFRRAVERRTRRILGDVTAVGPRFSYPVGSLLADDYAGPRLALVGESAHALPPIGAQGLNLGITDVATLIEVLVAAERAGRDIGDPEVTRGYARRRRPDVVARAFAVDMLNRTVQSKLPPIGFVRRHALGLVDRVSPLKARLMRQGMLPVGQLPQLMDGVAPWAR